MFTTIHSQYIYNSSHTYHSADELLQPMRRSFKGNQTLRGRKREAESRTWRMRMSTLGNCRWRSPHEMRDSAAMTKVAPIVAQRLRATAGVTMYLLTPALLITYCTGCWQRTLASSSLAAPQALTGIGLLYEAAAIKDSLKSHMPVATALNITACNYK